MLVFDRSEEIPGETGIFIRSQVEETWNVFSNPRNIFSGTSKIAGYKTEIHVHWNAPPTDWWALNTDGAAKGSPGPAGGGGVIRNEEGRFIKGFAANYGICNAYRAEMLALEQGLQMAKQQGIKKLIIQMDNKACVEAINNSDQHHGECMHIINNCRSLCNWFCSFVFVHCYREGNRVADRLANLGVSLQERVVYFDDPPIEIKNALWEDLVGVALPRMVV